MVALRPSTSDLLEVLIKDAECWVIAYIFIHINILLLPLKTILLKYNLHSMEFTQFQCKINEL